MFAKCEINQYFPSCVWVHELSDYKAMNDRMAEELARLRASGSGTLSKLGSWQSRGDLHRQDAFRPLAQCMAAASRGVLDFLKCKYEDFEITDCWANTNASGQSHQIHTHPNNLLSGVYYVRAPGNCGDIVFHDPRQQAIVLIPTVTERTPFNAAKHNIPPKEGRLLVFPSWFQHNVETNESDVERISISFNIMLRGGMGYESGAANF